VCCRYLSVSASEQGKRKKRFTSLLRHVDVDILRTAYKKLRRDAAPGVDGLIWKQWRQNLDTRLTDPSVRIYPV